MTERLSPDPEDAERELVRLADRVRLVAPRLAARDTPAGWQTLDQVRAGLQELADRAADAGDAADTVEAANAVEAGRRQVPELGVHALADQVLVLGHELLSGPAGSSDVRRAEVVRALAAIRELL